MNLFGKKKVKCKSGQTPAEAKLTYVKKSKIKGAGSGLFAKTNLKKGMKLGFYDGEYMNEKKYQSTKDQNYIWQVNSNPNRYVDARRCKKAILRFINGARTKEQKKNVNVEPYTYGGKLYYRTIKKVKKDTELIIDYGDYYW